VEESNIDQYTIYDIVLPLPGFDVVYPNHELRADYRQALAKDGIDMDHMKHKIK
jgi:tRNA pseudouridine13 synthase